MLLKVINTSLTGMKFSNISASPQRHTLVFDFMRYNVTLYFVLEETITFDQTSILLMLCCRKFRLDFQKIYRRLSPSFFFDFELLIFGCVEFYVEWLFIYFKEQ